MPSDFGIKAKLAVHHSLGERETHTGTWQISWEFQIPIPVPFLAKSVWMWDSGCEHLAFESGLVSASSTWDPVKAFPSSNSRSGMGRDFPVSPEGGQMERGAGRVPEGVADAVPCHSTPTRVDVASREA